MQQYEPTSSTASRDGDGSNSNLAATFSDAVLTTHDTSARCFRLGDRRARATSRARPVRALRTAQLFELPELCDAHSRGGRRRAQISVGRTLPGRMRVRHR